MPVTRENFGTGLQALGAGFQGRGVEFQQLQAQQGRERQAQTDKLSQEREQAFAIDTRILRDHLENGRIPQGKELLINRLQTLKQIDPGADDRDTAQALQLIDQDPEMLGELVKEMDMRFTLKGLVPEYKTASPEIIGKSDIADGFIVEKMPGGKFRTTKVLETANVSDSGKASAVTKIFNDGTTIQALPNAKVQVVNPNGDIVEGTERLDALRLARENEIDFEQTKSGAKAAGTAAIGFSEKALEKMDKIRPAIANIEEAVSLIDQGAQTGTIMSKLPSITSASKQLDNLQGRMGLDVIGNTTFGALSESELKFALSVALPKDLKPEALKDWLTRKRDAQQKLMSYLQDVAIYTGTPGNTIAGWIEAQKALQSQATGRPDSGIKFIGFK